MASRKHYYRRFLPHFQGNGGALFITYCTWKRWVLPGLARDLALQAGLQAHGKLCTLHVAVVMPDHVHLILTPLSDCEGPIPVPEILRDIKSRSAHEINRMLKRTGRVWQDESFDHVLRRSESVDQKIGYVLNNPVRAGLVEDFRKYQWVWRSTTGGPGPAPTFENGSSTIF